MLATLNQSATDLGILKRQHALVAATQQDQLVVMGSQTPVSASQRVPTMQDMA